MDDIPEGFEPLFRTSPFTALLGPIYQKKKSLADIALGYNAAFPTEPPTPMVTASQSIDYAGAAKEGDWIEIHTDVQKVGRSLAFANGYFFVDAKRIARASAVFSVG